MARQVFYSFHYQPDNWRAGQVRNVGVVEGNQPCADNDWESITRAGEGAIRSWIDGQLSGKSCAVVLIGASTAGRKWINYEIEKAWNSGKGLVGVHIHGLKDVNQMQTFKGSNPFALFSISGTPLSSIVRTCDPPYALSTDVYAYIKANLAGWVEEAITIRGNYP